MDIEIAFAAFLFTAFYLAVAKFVMMILSTIEVKDKE